MMMMVMTMMMVMMMTDWIRCRRSFELVKCRWIWNALQPITWPANTWCTISLHQQGMSEGIIECSTMVIPVVTALGIFLESAVVQMPRLDYSFQPENILHRVLHWKYILHDGAMHWKKAFNLRSIACQTFFFITWQSFLGNALWRAAVIFGYKVYDLVEKGCNRLMLHPSIRERK